MSVVTADGRVIVVKFNNQHISINMTMLFVVDGDNEKKIDTVFQGVLKGFDQTVNMILAQSHERVYSSGAGVEKVQLGLYIIRGDNM